MRNLLVCLIILSPYLASAQQYKVFRNLGISYYDSGEQHTAMVVETLPFSGGDTLFQFYSVTMEDGQQPGSCTHGIDHIPFTGEKLLITDSIINNYLFNDQGDSIRFRPGEALGTTFWMYKFPDGRILEATVVDDRYRTILGQYEPVKIWRMQVKDNQGNQVPHIMNGREWEITLRMGFLTAFNIRNFPNDTTQYHLVGYTGLQAGVFHPTNTRIHSILPGQEMHYTGYREDCGFAGCDTTFTFEKRFALQRNQSGDTLVLTYKRTLVEIYQPTSDTTVFHDTITDTTYLNALAYLDGVNRAYFEYEPGLFGYSVVYRDSTTGPRFWKRMYFGHLLDSANQCLERINPQDTFPLIAYGDGLGITWIRTTNQITQMENRLVYYQRGVTTWGEPVNFSQMLRVPHARQPQLRVWPNPVGDVLQVSVEGFAGEMLVEVFAMDGRLLHRQVAISAEGVTIIPATLWPSGVLLVRCSTASGVASTRIVKP
jgi:hypothetical protein